MSPSARTSPDLRWRWLPAVAALAVLFHFVPFGGPALDRALFDAASRHPLRAAPVPRNSALVLVDENTLQLLGREPYTQRWPFPRAYFAALVAALDRAGAERIVLDFTFLEHSDAPEQDALLAAVAAGSPRVVLARMRQQAPVFWDDDYTRDHAALFREPRAGLADFPADADGIARFYPWAGSLAQVASGRPAPGGLVRWHGGLNQLKARGVPVLTAGPYFVAGLPLVDRLAAAVPELAPERMREALADEPPLSGALADAVRGRVVFVGANAQGTYDLKPFPVGKVEPGVLLHWTAWANAEAGGFIVPVPRWGALVLAAVAAGLLLVGAERRPGLAVPVVLTAGLVAGLVGAAYALLSFGWFLPPATPALAAVLVLLGIVADNFWAEQRRKREIQSMFGAYVDPTVVSALVRNPEAIRLGGERRAATVFFCDLAGFTDLSEQVPPEELFAIVNRYLDEVSECLLDHGAYIDKYIGDAVMAVFGAPKELPDHAASACAGALAAQRVLARINVEIRAKYRRTLAMRIGLNSGEMIVGNLGSARKRNYSVLGDTVNLASRLEGANKEFGTSILLGETTARAVAGKFATRPLTRLRVKGKQTAVEVHELVGEPGKLTPATREFLDAYAAGYAHFTARSFAAAAADFRRALALAPDDDVTRELLAQSDAFVLTPPAPDWEPILILKSK